MVWNYCCLCLIWNLVCSNAIECFLSFIHSFIHSFCLYSENLLLVQSHLADEKTEMTARACMRESEYTLCLLYFVSRAHTLSTFDMRLDQHSIEDMAKWQWNKRKNTNRRSLFVFFMSVNRSDTFDDGEFSPSFKIHSIISLNSLVSVWCHCLLSMACWSVGECCFVAIYFSSVNVHPLKAVSC